jgi:hypothetical protein
MKANRILDALLRVMRMPPSTNGTIFVDTATPDDWNTFIVRDDLPTKAQFLQWFAETNEIHIVEFGPSQTHEALVIVLAELFRAAPNVRDWLAPGGGSMNSQGPAYLPDLSYGPKRTTPGAVLPAGIARWRDFKTIRVEFGVSQRWGVSAGQLDHKARTVWAPMTGVEYVLCIKSNDDTLTDVSYKLYDVTTNGPPPRFTVQLNPVQIVPGIVVDFDAHRVLGIPAAGPLPAGFPDPYRVDLYAALVEARTSNL